jgi:excisionase family DNA binding protein
MYTDPFDDHITVQEAARLLQVSRPTVYRLIERGELRYAQHPVTGRKRLSRMQVAGLLSGEGTGGGGAQSPMADRVSDVAGDPYLAARPARDGEIVDSIFRLPELNLDFGVDDLSEKVDYYRLHGLPGEAAGVPGHLGPGGDEHQHGSALPPGRA